ncbi:hypothetical protein [Aliikangiella coralliicola]|uniref:Porin family protein n=1 Tax=Aliikangiella coralliicola TaxID=2592383 RepID=A0A545UIG7_9GAMM|nr:hypothetical protein [Aliikangiella coralliicola]TQV89264.1 hypothetical protein FLL46_03800 [Aliikangiella coralliicola]
MIKKFFWGACALMSFSAMAERPSFTFVEVGQTELEHEVVDGDFTGYDFEISYELKDFFYLSGKVISTSDGDLKNETKSIGIGYQELIFTDTVMYIQADAVGVVFTRPNAGEFDEQGNQFTIGLKSNVTDWFEVDVAVKRLDAGEVDATFGDYRIDYGFVGLNFKVFDEFSIYANYQEESDSKRQSVGFRYDF